MTAVMLFDAAVAALIIGLAIACVALRDAFAAVVAFVAYGVALAVAWVRLQAPDVALTEAAIGSGLTGALLIGVAAELRRSRKVQLPLQRPGLALRTAAAVACASLVALLAAAFVALPEPAPSLAGEASARLAETGLGNPVTATLIAYRATDTMLEKVVLVLALVGVWSLAPDRWWGARPSVRPDGAPHGALVLLARVLPPVGIVVASYVLWVGADHPGGAFAGGTILAAMALLVVLAGLADVPPVASRALRAMVVAGPMVFLAVGLLGILVAGAFLAYPPAIAKPVIVFVEVALMLSVAATLALLLAGAPAREAAK
jgi:multisubunit Na+/H+ antiporter MnhB subunit